MPKKVGSRLRMVTQKHNQGPFPVTPTPVPRYKNNYLGVNLILSFRQMPYLIKNHKILNTTDLS